MEGLAKLFGLGKSEVVETETTDETQTEATAATETETGAVATEQESTTEAAVTETAIAETSVQESVGVVTLSVAEYDAMKANAGLVDSLKAKVSAFEAKAKKWDAHEAALGNAGVGGDTATAETPDASAAEKQIREKYFHMK